MKQTALFFMCMCLSSCTNMALQPTKVQYFDITKYTPQKPHAYFIESYDGTKLSVVHFKNLDHKKRLIIQMHGNAENLSSHFLSQLWVTQYGYDFMTFDYRGYGQSEGFANFPDVNNDTTVFLKHVMSTYPDYELVIWAESLGGMMVLNALNELSKQGVELPKYKLILEGTFYSLKSTSAHVLTRHWLTLPFSWAGHLLVSNRYAPKKNLKQFELKATDVMVVHSQHDPIVPFKQSQRLYKKIVHHHKCMLWYDEKNHINVAGVHERKYRNQVLSFLEKGCESATKDKEILNTKNELLH